MNEHDAILGRLRGLANAPVDDAVAQQHLQALADIGAAPSAPSRRGRMVVMGAVVAGAFVGSATLAGALTGNLPDPAQDAAHVALAKVGIDVPEAKGKSAQAKDDSDGPGKVERFLGDATTPCTLPDGSPFVGNHGQYVKAHEDDPATADVNERELAAQSPCGKPLSAVEGGPEAGDADAGTESEHGKPDSPGKSADHKPDDAGKPEDAGTPESPGKSADHKPDDAGKPDTDTDDTED